MEKQLLPKNILIELNQLPGAYLLHWYELIHTFREKLPVQESASMPSKEADFDWDAFVEVVMKNRSQRNRPLICRMGTALEN